MKSLFTFLPIFCILSCRPKEEVPTDVPAQISGKYLVQNYAVNDDTLYVHESISPGMNKIGVSEFYILIERKNADSVRMKQVYKRIGDISTSMFIKDVAVKEIDDSFQLISSTSPFYVGRITLTHLYEFTPLHRLGAILLPHNYSLREPSSPEREKGVLIIATK